jgi:hypothetical protein
LDVSARQLNAVDEDTGDEFDMFREEQGFDDAEDLLYAPAANSAAAAAAAVAGGKKQNVNAFTPVNFNDCIWHSANVSQRSIVAGSHFLASKDSSSKIYGVAYTAMTVGGGNGRSPPMVMCENITLFPTEYWVIKGLYCINKLLHHQSLSYLSTTPMEDKTMCLEGCLEVQEQLKLLKNSEIAPNQELISQLETLFK